MAQAAFTRLPALDLLRFIAAMAVTLYHYVTCYPAAKDTAGTFVGALSSVTRYGYLGVDLFFMISGFVILWSSLNRDSLSFVISRISRLYPSFWISLGFSVLLIELLSDVVPNVQTTPLSFRTIAANATMLPAVLNAPFIEDVYWTLEIEIRFYAIIFLLLLFGQMRRVEWWLYGWLAVSTIGLLLHLPWLVEYAVLNPYAPFFIAGCLFYLVLSNGRTPARVTALAVSATGCVYASLVQRGEFITPDDASALIVPALVLFFFALFALLTIRSSAFSHSDIAYSLGALTYPLYLTHAIMGVFVYQLLYPKLGVAAALGVISILALALAWLITVTVDIPARKPLAALLYRLARVLNICSPIKGDALR